MEVSDFVIRFQFVGERVIQQVSKNAISKIKHAEGKSEIVSEYIQINGKDDFERVKLLLLPEQTEGLKKLGEIEGKTSGGLTLHTSGTADQSSSNRIRRAAARLGAAFVLIQNNTNVSIYLGPKQSYKSGIAYGYK
jgi:hypothetical protein